MNEEHALLEVEGATQCVHACMLGEGDALELLPGFLDPLTLQSLG